MTGTNALTHLQTTSPELSCSPADPQIFALSFIHQLPTISTHRGNFLVRLVAQLATAPSDQWTSRTSGPVGPVRPVDQSDQSDQGTSRTSWTSWTRWGCGEMGFDRKIDDKDPKTSSSSPPSSEVISLLTQRKSQLMFGLIFHGPASQGRPLLGSL